MTSMTKEEMLEKLREFIDRGRLLNTRPTWGDVPDHEMVAQEDGHYCGVQETYDNLEEFLESLED